MSEEQPVSKPIVIKSRIGVPLAMLMPSPMGSSPTFTYPEKDMPIPTLKTEPTLHYPEKGMEYPQLKTESLTVIKSPIGDPLAMLISFPAPKQSAPSSPTMIKSRIGDPLAVLWKPSSSFSVSANFGLPKALRKELNLK